MLNKIKIPPVSTYIRPKIKSRLFLQKPEMKNIIPCILSTGDILLVKGTGEIKENAMLTPKIQHKQVLSKS